ncbi:MAG: hypothetical protein IJV80_03440 [Clostridia bacterium]|nr:hypothetical protein [Clostridia bacterium]
MTKEEFLQTLLVMLKDEIVGEVVLERGNVLVRLENGETFCVSVKKA